MGQDAIINNEQEAKEYLDGQKRVFGDSFALSPMPEEMYQHIDPLEEANDMRR